MTEPTRGLLDTSVVIDYDVIDPALLPDEAAISAITLTELAAGPHATEELRMNALDVRTTANIRPYMRAASASNGNGSLVAGAYN